MESKSIIKRVKNPYFILAGASFLYHVLESCGVKVEIDTYQSFVDLATYVFIGVGIYHTFDAKNSDKE